MTTVSAPEIATDRIDGVLQVFQTASHPLTLKQVQKLYTGPKLGRNELPRIVEENLMMSGRLFKCSLSGSQPRYWVHDEEQRIRETLEEMLSREPMPESRLTMAVNKSLPKVSSPQAIRAVIERMRLDHQLHDVPGKGSAKVLSLKPLDPATLLRPGTLKDLSEARAKAATFGIILDQFLERLRELLRTVETVPETSADLPEGQPTQTIGEAPNPSPSVELEELILKGMRDLDSTVPSGTPMLLRDLRRHMPDEYRRHETFDAAVFRLEEQGRVDLQRHDQPSFLTAEEQDELVRDDAGTCYTSIAMRVTESSEQNTDRMESTADQVSSRRE